jgi:hypothetical protein
MESSRDAVRKSSFIGTAPLPSVESVALEASIDSAIAPAHDLSSHLFMPVSFSLAAIHLIAGFAENTTTLGLYR